MPTRTTPGLSCQVEYSMMRAHSEELFKKYGFEKGLDLLNVLTAQQLGMITERRVVDFVRDNVTFFIPEPEPLLQDD